MGEQRPFAVFDIDGTLIRWQLYHAIVDALAKAGKIDPEKFASAKAARMVWKNRVNDDSFDDYQAALVAVYDEALRKISYAEYLAAVNEVFDEYKGQTYTFTRDLIKDLKAKNYLLFAISASQSEIVKLLAEHYGFDDFAASTYPLKNGEFTGRKEVLFGKQKPAYLKNLVKKHDATYDGSIGIGDSDGDILMLEIVERPVAFNPNKKLFQYAQKQGWKIVIERKNVIYEMEQGDGKYILAQANAG